MMKILKREVPTDTRLFALSLPHRARIVHVQMDQSGTPSLWIAGDPTAVMEDRNFMTVPTGLEFDIGTNDLFVGSFVIATKAWHLFELR